MPRPSRQGTRASSLLNANSDSKPSVLFDASNDSAIKEVDVRPPFVERGADDNVFRLAEHTSVGGTYFSPFDILSKLEIDFPREDNNINYITSSQMQVKLLELVKALRSAAELIELSIHQAGPSESLDISTPAAGTLAREIRNHVFSVFRLTANSLGRSGHAAVLEDTRAMVSRLISYGQVSMYSPASGGKLDQDPESWIKNTVVPRLDADMTMSSVGDQIPVYNLSVYKDDGKIPRLKRFYDSLAYWRRNRLRVDEEVSTLVAARAYSRKKRA
jgi:hypothetical protein